MNIFRTTELSFAAYLVGKGIKYLGPERITGNSYYFTFENPEKCYELEKEFLTFKDQLLKGFDYKKQS